MSDFTINYKDVLKFKEGEERRQYPDNTMYGVVNQILELDRQAPEFELRLKGLIKRFWHYEKADMYEKFATWLKHHGQEYTENTILPLKIQTHKEWSKFSDEKIWTSK